MADASEPDPPRLGPAGAGDDMQRLIDDLRSKGMSQRQIDVLRASWEAACHDPMRKGRGGPSLPENSPKGRVPLPKPPLRDPSREGPAPRSGQEPSDLVDLLDRTAPWPEPKG